MNPLAALRQPASVSVRLETRTPLYTGGVGQHGDQLHPASILGGLRRFSCRLAAALGEKDFEHDTWGTDANAKDNRHAKRMALRLDTTSLIRVDLPDRINWPRADQQKRPGWFYNCAFEGSLGLTLTRRGISDWHWQLLLLALRIQLRHATLGAKDQFGLGVMEPDLLPDVAPLQNGKAESLNDVVHLGNAFFARVEFDEPAPGGLHERLERGLRWREHLRGSLRRPGCTGLRHYVFGELNQTGSAVNVSAVYPVSSDTCALRIWGVLPHTQPARFLDKRGDVMTALRGAIDQGPGSPARFVWQDGGRHTGDLRGWFNQLAGVE